MGWAMKLGGLPDETWTTIDIHANCQPKAPVQTLHFDYDPRQGLVQVQRQTYSTASAAATWTVTP
jgi:hypothetical protein